MLEHSDLDEAAYAHATTLAHLLGAILFGAVALLGLMLCSAIVGDRVALFFAVAAMGLGYLSQVSAALCVLAGGSPGWDRLSLFGNVGSIVLGTMAGLFLTL